MDLPCNSRPPQTTPLSPYSPPPTQVGRSGLGGDARVTNTLPHPTSAQEMAVRKSPFCSQSTSGYLSRCRMPLPWTCARIPELLRTCFVFSWYFRVFLLLFCLLFSFFIVSFVYYLTLTLLPLPNLTTLPHRPTPRHCKTHAAKPGLTACLSMFVECCTENVKEERTCAINHLRPFGASSFPFFGLARANAEPFLCECQAPFFSCLGCNFSACSLALPRSRYFPVFILIFACARNRSPIRLPWTCDCVLVLPGHQRKALPAQLHLCPTLCPPNSLSLLPPTGALFFSY